MKYHVFSGIAFGVANFKSIIVKADRYSKINYVSCDWDVVLGEMYLKI